MHTQDTVLSILFVFRGTALSYFIQIYCKQTHIVLKKSYQVSHIWCLSHAVRVHLINLIRFFYNKFG